MEKIIHVDNSDFFRKLVKTFLNEQGFFVESFNHGAEALDAISSGEVLLIITGLSFSDMEGSEFIKRAIGHPYNIPIIALTSNQSPEMEFLLHDLGIKGRVLKSGAWQEQLMPMIEQCLAQR